MSLNAETCLSEFRNKEKSNPNERPKQNTNVANMLDELNDTSDMLYNAYAEAQKSR